jgi:DNA-binding TFAR19-related protein (PDSD5 family)
MAGDESLEALRQKRLAELQGQHGDFGVNQTHFV